MRAEVLIYDAFSDMPGKGNPAGVVLSGHELSDFQMQEIARKLNFNETAFVIRNKDNICLRYFTPGREVPMCGHATIAAMYALVEHGMVETENTTIQTKSGTLKIEIIDEGCIKIGMQQVSYRELAYKDNIENIAYVLGLEGDMIDDRYPVRYANTGLWTLLVPIKNLSCFRTMHPCTKEFPGVLKEMSTASIHPFCTETYNANCQLHGRHFSSPYSGTVEDAVTGTACGAMGIYYQKYICPSNENRRIRIEQGNEIGRDGIVEVEIPKELSNPVKIYGTAAFSGKTDIDL